MNFDLRNLREAKLEIELKCRVVWSSVAILVHESEAKLNDLQEINVAA